MASHIVIKPVRHAGVASQDTIFISGGAIASGAPVVFSGGKVVEATDGADGGVVCSDAAPATAIVGIALHAVSAANIDVQVALALPGRRFIASHGDNTTSGGTDAGTYALALADIGKLFELHKDATTLKWVIGAASAGGKGGVMVTALVDKVGATTIDTRSFGESGSSTGVTPATGATAGDAAYASGQTSVTPPLSTFSQNPPSGPNFGTAREEFIFPVGSTIYGVCTA
jgi:hypothetical protein